ncbi:putative ribonuclease H-like domain-containing protein, partial [Tanacetum coccineum]
MILNTLDHLGKFDAKGDEGYFVGYSMNSKAFRVFNKRTKKIDENLHVDFLDNQPIEKGTGLNWLFDIDSLTKSMNYVPVVVVGTSSTKISGTKEDALKENNRDAFSEKGDPQKEQDRIISDTGVSESSGNTNPTIITKDPSAEQVEPALSLTVETEVPTVSTPVPTECLSIPPYCLFSCFSSQEEPKKIFDALKDPSWVEAMQEELLQFKIHNVWVLVDCPNGVRPIGTKWVLKNKRDERGIVIRNKARLVAQ